MEGLIGFLEQTLFAIGLWVLVIGITPRFAAAIRRSRMSQWRRVGFGALVWAPYVLLSYLFPAESGGELAIGGVVGSLAGVLSLIGLVELAQRVGASTASDAKSSGAYRSIVLGGLAICSVAILSSSMGLLTLGFADALGLGSVSLLTIVTLVYGAGSFVAGCANFGSVGRGDGARSGGAAASGRPSRPRRGRGGGGGGASDGGRRGRGGAASGRGPNEGAQRGRGSSQRPDRPRASEESGGGDAD